MVVKPANKAVAPTVPSRSYMNPAKRGNANAVVQRKNVLPAMADAAAGRYATTRYVNTEVKEKQTPVPKGMDAMMGTIQWTFLYVVKAIQKSPIGIRTAPNCPMTSLKGR